MEIKVCPFCGQEPLVFISGDIEYSPVVWYYYACHNIKCYVRPKSCRRSSQRDAANQWNWRGDGGQ